jgi:hypothetical protein
MHCFPHHGYSLSSRSIKGAPPDCVPWAPARAAAAEVQICTFMLVRITYRSLTILCSKAPVTMTAIIAGQSLVGISKPTIIPVANVTIGPRSAARQRAVNPLASQGGTGSRGPERSYSEKRLFIFHAPSEATQQSFLLFTTLAVGGCINCPSLRERQRATVLLRNVHARCAPLAMGRETLALPIADRSVDRPF